MSGVHWHLILNHAPVTGAIVVLLLLVAAFVLRNDPMKRVCLAALVIIALIAIPAYLTGESAEEVAEGLPGVSDAVIDRHHSVAGFAFWTMEALGLVSLAGLVAFRNGRRWPAWFGAALLVIGAAAGGLMVTTANLGGEIRHTEIRADVLSGIGGGGQEGDEGARQSGEGGEERRGGDHDEH